MSGITRAEVEKSKPFKKRRILLVLSGFYCFTLSANIRFRLLGVSVEFWDKQYHRCVKVAGMLTLGAVLAGCGAKESTVRQFFSTDICDYKLADKKKP